MSVYYAVICEKCKEKTDAVSSNLSGYQPLIDSDTTLLPFLVAHHRCPIKVISENDDEFNDKEYEEWNKNNLLDMLAKNHKY